MTTGPSIFLFLSVLLFIAVTIQILLRRSRKKDKLSLDADWQNFLTASSTEDIEGINNYGDKLIWNKYLKQNQLTQISKVVELNIDKYPELKKLKLNAYNKQLHYNRTLDAGPYG